MASSSLLPDHTDDRDSYGPPVHPQDPHIAQLHTVSSLLMQAGALVHPHKQTDNHSR